MRTRFFSLITYIPTDELLDIISNCSNIRYYAYIYHDKDVNKDGSPVTPHTHLLITTYNATTTSAVCKWFKQNKNNQNTFSEKIKSKNIYDYLTHEGFEDKYQYSKDDIVSNNLDYWINIEPSADDNTQKTLSLLDDIINNVPMRTMVERYGRDYVINYGKYQNFAIMMSQQKSIDEYTNMVLHMHWLNDNYIDLEQSTIDDYGVGDKRTR